MPATQIGKRLPRHLTLNVILPPDLGPPHTVAALDRYLDVEVTLWWAFDHDSTVTEGGSPAASARASPAP